MPTRTLLAISGLFAFLIGEAPVFATLGEQLDSVALRSFANYSVHESAEKNGPIVRQYTDRNKVVFALNWEGRSLPNLKLLLGAYFDAFAEASKAQNHRRGPLVLEVGDLLVVSGGHQRDLRGLSLVKSLLPEGVTLEDLK